jgi:hypothetical protein
MIRGGALHGSGPVIDNSGMAQADCRENVGGDAFAHIGTAGIADFGNKEREQWPK